MPSLFHQLSDYLQIHPIPEDELEIHLSTEEGDINIQALLSGCHVKIDVKHLPSEFD